MVGARRPTITNSSGGIIMSDISAVPGWWIASDGKWYPPELHPSVRGAHPGQIGGAEGAPTQQRHDQPDAASGSQVGPRFPDLFQVAMQGSSYADTVSVKYDGSDERSGHPQPAGASATASGTSCLLYTSDAA